MIKKLESKDPYATLLSDDLCGTAIFDQIPNSLLSVLDRDDHNHTILIEKTFRNTFNETVGAGYYFIQCLEWICQGDDLKQFRILLERIVNRNAKGNYMEVEPILIAPEFNHEVTRFVEQYNNLQRRKPIQLLIFEAP